jgi:uncharacterized protein YjgD (DUF1641 family)
VGVGLLSMMGLIGGNLTMLRTLRAFRVFRLFKRVKALNKILQVKWHTSSYVMGWG